MQSTDSKSIHLPRRKEEMMAGKEDCLNLIPTEADAVCQTAASPPLHIGPQGSID